MGPYSTREILLKVSTDLWIHRGNGIRANQDAERRWKSWEEGLITLRIQLSLAEVSLAKLATGSSSRKGLCGHSPKDWKHGAQMRGEVYSLPNWAQNVNGSRTCCSVVFTDREQGEILWTDLLSGVFTSNPRGDRLKRLDGHKNREAWECGASLFFMSLLIYPMVYFS